MVVVMVYTLEGKNSEYRAGVIKEITDVFVRRGSKAEAVRVLIHEVPKVDYGVGGKPNA